MGIEHAAEHEGNWLQIVKDSSSSSEVFQLNTSSLPASMEGFVNQLESSLCCRSLVFIGVQLQSLTTKRLAHFSGDTLVVDAEHFEEIVA